MRQFDQPPELEIARISGRRPAVLAMVAVVGVLVAVVWVGMSGRTDPRPAPTFPAVADIPTETPEPTAAATPVATPDAAPDPTATPQVPSDLYGASVQLGDVMSSIVLTEVEPGRLFGRIRLTLPPPETAGTFLFQQFSSQRVPGQPVPIADWPIDVQALAADSPQFLAVNATLPARRTIRDAPRPVERGYHLTVTGQRKGAEGELTINVSMGPNRQLEGNDGILGWPIVSQLRPPDSDPGEGEQNSCRTYEGVEAAPPRPDPDRLDC